MTNELVTSKYTFSCDPDECDCLIEVTSSDGFGFPSGVVELTCPCGRKANLLSVVNATLQPTPTTKGNEMPIVNEYVENAIVVLKKVAGTYAAPESPEYTEMTVSAIEWQLDISEKRKIALDKYEDRISAVKDIILEAYQDSDDQEVLTSIADILDIELTKEIAWEAVIHASGTITVSLTEDYDMESELSDALYVEAHNGDIEINDYTVDSARESY